MGNEAVETRPQETSRTEKLSEEIIEAQKCRADFLKWKLISVAALGAVGFGVSKEISAAPLALALVPLVCIYVDLVCMNCNIRQIVIGTFYATVRQDPYERFVQRNRRMFDFEDWALYPSTWVSCAMVIVVGFGMYFQNLRTFPEKTKAAAATNGTNVASTGALSNGVANGTNVVAGGEKKSAEDSAWKNPTVQGLFLMVSGLCGGLLSLSIRRRHLARMKMLIPLVETQVIHNKKLGAVMRPDYTRTELETLRRFLAEKGVFIFHSLPNGLFSAAAFASTEDESGYHYVWVRDNIHIAHAHFVCGDNETAGRVLGVLMQFFRKSQHRFEEIFERGKGHAADPMNRPHVRFDGERLEEVKQKWAHAQNDALGYFLWCYCKMARAGVVPCGEKEMKCLVNFPLYFQVIEYWQDKDSGHWEEARKVSASSIGTVLAGLREFEELVEEKSWWTEPALKERGLDQVLLQKLRTHGREALDKILPCESLDPDNYRRYDSALLFLIYPLEVVEGEQAARILNDVQMHLQGDHGIRRYLGDSYWCADYKEKLPANVRTGDFSEDMSKRDALARPGEEAQWCIFDPIISIIYGKRYEALKEEGGHEDECERMRQLQVEYLNRALGQLTGESRSVPEFRTPEAYYLEKRKYVPNDHTPLLWAQANLWMALHQMERD